MDQLEKRLLLVYQISYQQGWQLEVSAQRPPGLHHEKASLEARPNPHRLIAPRAEALPIAYRIVITV